MWGNTSFTRRQPVWGEAGRFTPIRPSHQPPFLMGNPTFFALWLFGSLTLPTDILRRALVVLLDHPDRFHKSRPPSGHPASVRWLNGTPSYPPIGSRKSFLPKRTPMESPSRLRRCRTSRRPNPGPAQVKTPVGFDPCQPTPPESFNLLNLTRLLSIPSKAHNPGQIRVPCRCQTKSRIDRWGIATIWLFDNPKITRNVGFPSVLSRIIRWILLTPSRWLAETRE